MSLHQQNQVFLFNHINNINIYFYLVIWVWLRFNPSDNTTETLRDSARFNLAFRGTGYISQSIDSLVETRVLINII